MSQRIQMRDVALDAEQDSPEIAAPMTLGLVGIAIIVDLVFLLWPDRRNL